MGEVMNKQCKFQVGKYHCGSYAFNLYKENIEQGNYCDRHYWQEKATEAAAHEREACAKVCDEYAKNSSNPMNFAYNCATTIRARRTT